MLALDHAIVFVRRLELAGQAFRRLGFTVSPRGDHQGLGTANHTIMLERTYFELLSVVEPTAGNRRWAEILDRREGFGGVALRTTDARATRGTLVARGIQVPDPTDFGRPVTTPSGTAEARFTIAHLPPDATPALPAFFCQHHTPELVWLPELTTHPNTAVHLAGLTVVHPDPDQAAGGWERLLGRASVHPHPGGIAIDLRSTRLWLVRPDFAKVRLGHPVDSHDGVVPYGLSILVRDLDRARRLLTANGVSHLPFGPRSIAVGPKWAAGVHLELIAA